MSEEFDPTVYDTVHDAVADTLRVQPGPDRRHVVVSYVAVDPFPPASFWPSDGTKGRLEEPGALSDEDRFALPVVLTEEGALVAMPDAGSQPDARLYVPPGNVVRAHDDDPRGLVEWCTRQLAAYSSWRRGETYGLVTETVRVEGSEPVKVECDWLHSDLDGAVATLDARIPPEPVRPPGP